MEQGAFSANIQISILKEGKKFIAYSPALELSTSGKTHEEARERFLEAAQLFFEEVLKKKTLFEALQELGWKKAQTHWVPPRVISQESRAIRVPVHA